MMQDQKGCKKNNIRSEEEQITAARAKQHEDEEKDTGIRPKKTKDRKKKPTGVLNNVMQEDYKGCKKNNTRAKQERTTAARAKQHEDEEEDTGKRPAGRENKGTKRETRQKCTIIYGMYRYQRFSCRIRTYEYMNAYLPFVTYV